MNIDTKINIGSFLALVSLATTSAFSYVTMRPEPRVALYNVDDAVSIYTAAGEMLFRGDVLASYDSTLVVSVMVDGKVKKLSKRKTVVLDLRQPFLVVSDEPTCDFKTKRCEVRR